MTMKMKNKSHRYDINRPTGIRMDPNIVHIYRNVSHYDDAYIH